RRPNPTPQTESQKTKAQTPKSKPQTPKPKAQTPNPNYHLPTTGLTKIFSRHSQPQRPIVLGVLAPDIKPMRNPLAAHDLRHVEIMAQADVPLSRPKHDLHLPIPAQEPLI